MDKLFEIGGFCFRITSNDEFEIPENFKLFCVQEGEPAYTYNIVLSDNLPTVKGRVTARRRDLVVFETPNGEGRLIGVAGIPRPYALYCEKDEKNAEITVFSDWADMLNQDTVFTSLFALERRIIDLGAIVLHCAYICRDGEAILFSAPSETGKTTQANLWGKYRGTPTVNGDRALLKQLDGVWHACGWPVCGSSGVCNNRSMPIRAIVMLSQGKENTVERLKGSGAFMQLFSQITVNRWNSQSSQRTIDLIEDLIGKVPVYHLSCTISQEAVECLEQAIYSEEFSNLPGKSV